MNPKFVESTNGDIFYTFIFKYSIRNSLVNISPESRRVIHPNKGKNVQKNSYPPKIQFPLIEKRWSRKRKKLHFVSTFTAILLNFLAEPNERVNSSPVQLRERNALLRCNAVQKKYIEKLFFISAHFSNIRISLSTNQSYTNYYTRLVKCKRNTATRDTRVKN